MADEVEIKDLTADAAPASTDELAKQAAAGGAGSTKKSTVAQIVAAAAPQAHAASHTDGGDDIQDATAAQKGVATAAQITKLDGIATGADVTGANAPQTHAGSHTDGGDDIQDATAAQKGVATATQITKLDGIATGADVTGSNAPQAHASSHQDGGSDELPVSSLAEAAAPGNDVSQALRPDGAGGVAFSDVAHADLTSVGFDDHKTVNTVSTTDGTVTTIETIAIADDTVVEIVAEIVGRRTDASDRIGGIIRATVFREAAAGVVVEGTSKDFAASQAQYDLNIVGSGNNALIQVTGRAAHNLNWRSVSKVNSVS